MVARRGSCLWILAVLVLSVTGCEPIRHVYEVRWFSGRGQLDRTLLTAESTARSADGRDLLVWDGRGATFEITHDGHTFRFSPEAPGSQTIAEFWASRVRLKQGIRPGDFDPRHFFPAGLLILAAIATVTAIHGRRRHGYVLPLATTFLFAVAGSFILWLLAVAAPVALGPWIWHGGAAMAAGVWILLLVRYLPHRDLTPAEAEMLSDLRIAGNFLTSREPLSDDQLRVIEMSSLPRALKNRIREVARRRETGTAAGNIIEVKKDGP